MSKNKKKGCGMTLLIGLIVVVLLGVGGYYFFTTPKEIDSERALTNLNEAVAEYAFDVTKEGLEIYAVIPDHKIELRETVTTQTGNAAAVTTTTNTTYQKSGDASNYQIFVISDTGDEDLKAGVYYWKDATKYYSAKGSKTNSPQEIDKETFMMVSGFCVISFDIFEPYDKVEGSGKKDAMRVLGYGLVKDNFKDGTMTITNTTINAANDTDNVKITLEKKISDPALRVTEITYTTKAVSGETTTKIERNYKITY